MMSWQVQEAKQQFSEVLRRARSDGPQVVTRHGDEVAVVIDIEDYRRLKGERASFEEFLTTPSGPYFDDLTEELDAIQGQRDMPRPVSFGED